MLRDVPIVPSVETMAHDQELEESTIEPTTGSALLDDVFSESTVEPTNGSALLDDVFSDSRPSSPTGTAPETLQPSEPSEIPRLRTIHTTAGYRDGIASSKIASLQPGFDEGYSLGAVLGLRVGNMLGIIDGISNALRDVKGMEEERGRILELSGQAKQELDLRNIFGRDFWGDDGIWKYDVLQMEEEQEGGVTFEKVADAHPLLSKWRIKVEELMGRFEVLEKPFAGEEWEQGRIGGEGDT